MCSGLPSRVEGNDLCQGGRRGRIGQQQLQDGLQMSLTVSLLPALDSRRSS